MSRSGVRVQLLLELGLGHRADHLVHHLPPLHEEDGRDGADPVTGRQRRLSSTFTFARLTEPLPSRTSSSSVGAMARQGAHHSAQNPPSAARVLAEFGVEVGLGQMQDIIGHERGSPSGWK
jgi:hypothetical protein